jgi:hypothetical protein
MPQLHRKEAMHTRGVYRGCLKPAVLPLMFLLRVSQTDILAKVNTVLALDKEDPSKEDSVKAVSSSGTVLC